MHGHVRWNMIYDMKRYNIKKRYVTIILEAFSLISYWGFGDLEPIGEEDIKKDNIQYS